MEFLGLAIQLMVVGMVTVFIILLIVIQLGKWLIQAVNKFAPPETVATKTVPTAQTIDAQTIDAQIMSVLQAAINEITGGKGHIKKAERL